VHSWLIVAALAGALLIVGLVMSADRSVSVAFTTTCEGLPSNAGNRGLISDCENLLAIRDRLAGTSTHLSNWNLGTPMEEWQGVVIEGSPKRVTKLRLGAKGLTGSIPARLGELSSLKELRLRGNKLTGYLPSKLGRLAALTHVYLGQNSFELCVPPHLRTVANNDVADTGLADCPPPTHLSQYFEKTVPPGTYWYNEYGDGIEGAIIFDVPPGLTVTYTGVAYGIGYPPAIMLDTDPDGMTGIAIDTVYERAHVFDASDAGGASGASGPSGPSQALVDLVDDSIWTGR